MNEAATMLINELWGLLTPDMSPEVWQDAVRKLATDCHVDVRKPIADRRPFTPVPKPVSTKVKRRGR